MSDWLDMLRGAYNFALRERVEAYKQVKAPLIGNYCLIENQAECCPLACSVNKSALYGYPWTKAGKRRSAYLQQDACLPQLKAERPWYKRVNADVLQMNLRRLNEAFTRFFDDQKKPESKRLGIGFPKPKRRSKFKSFSYKPGQVRIEGNRVRLPGIGWMTFFNSRPIPEGFDIRTVTVRQKSDGWYISVRLQDKSIPAPATVAIEEVQAPIGVDLGINKLASLSTGETIANPRFGQQQERRQAIRQRRASRKKKGSKNRRKAYQQLAKLGGKIEQQRNDFQWKLANQLAGQSDCIVFENLNIQGMSARCKPKTDPETGAFLPNAQAAKSGLNQAILDASWYSLKQKVKAVAAKSGTIAWEVDPRYTSQTCPVCGYVSPTNRNKEKFLCECCAHHDDADVNGAVNILNRGLKQLGISVAGVPREFTPSSELTGLSSERMSSVVVRNTEPENPLQRSLTERRGA